MSTGEILASLGFVAILLLVKGLWALTRRKGNDQFPYQRGPAVLSAAEQRFYSALVPAVGAGIIVLCKVRIADVIALRPYLSARTRLIALNRIAAKHFDFVLVDEADWRVIAVVELDDASHNKRSARARDQFVDEVCRSAAVAIVRIKAAGSYDAKSIEQRVLAAIEVTARSGYKKLQSQKRVEPALHKAVGVGEGGASKIEPALPAPLAPSAPPAPSPAPPIVEAMTTERETSQEQSAPVGQVEPKCPRCGGDMRTTVGKSGSLRGKEFLACKMYPVCVGVLPLPAQRRVA